MKVLLINPSSENEIIDNNPSIVEEERGYNPPLGLLYIAGYLEKFTEYSVEVLDTQVEELSYSVGKIFRERSAKNVVEEIEECVELEIKEIILLDS